MTSAVLQCIAVITMFIDHLGYEIFSNVPILRMIGRLSFPIFAFMLAEGFLHTRDRKKYVLRLAVFAVISELPYQIFSHGGIGNIFPLRPWENILFELLLAFGALRCVEKGKFWYFGAAALVVLAELGGFMYGAYGILLAIAFCVFKERRWAAMLSLTVLTLAYCLYFNNWTQIYAVAAVIPLGLYNGQKGQRLPRYFCYAFYPIHLLVIYGMYAAMKYI